jgi:hypothetical protein
LQRKSDFENFKKEPAAKKIKSGKTDFNKQEENVNLDDARIATIMSFRKRK